MKMLCENTSSAAHRHHMAIIYVSFTYSGPNILTSPKNGVWREYAPLILF